MISYTSRLIPGEVNKGITILLSKDMDTVPRQAHITGNNRRKDKEVADLAPAARPR